MKAKPPIMERSLTSENQLTSFFEYIYTWERLGKRISPRGITFLALPREQDGTETSHLWLHRFIPALTQAECEEMEATLNVALPDDMRQLYSTTNGASLFADLLSIYGWINVRMSDFGVGLVHNIYELQTMYRPHDARPSFFFFGSAKRYYNTLNYLYFDQDDGRIYLTEHRYTATPVASWDSFSEMLLEECKRLEKLFTTNGIMVEQPPNVDEAILAQGKALWAKALEDKSHKAG